MLQIVLLHGIEYVSFAFPYTDWYYLFEFIQGEKDMGTGKEQRITITSINKQYRACC